MKAMIWTNYGPPEVLQLQEIEKPLPREGEVLVRVHATTVTAGDCELRSLKGAPYLMLIMRMYVGFSKPTRITILGQELAGQVEAVGSDVKRYKAGDPVIAWTGLDLGTYAEYKCLPERRVLAIKPANLTYEEAAAIPVGGLEAAHFLRQANIQGGEKVLIVGAGGSIGTFAVQIARSLGAEVTAVDSAAKLDMLSSIGAGRVIDYAREDFARRGETYDVVFDAVGKSPYSRSLRLLNPGGRYLLANPRLSDRLRGTWTSTSRAKRVIFKTEGQESGDFVFLKELIEAGKVIPVIDRVYPLEQLAEAHRYVDTGQKKGNVVITIGHAPASLSADTV